MEDPYDPTKEFENSSESTKTVPVTVFHETGGDFGISAYVENEQPDLPEFTEQIEDWAQREFADLEGGEVRENAGVLEYVPNSRIVDIRRK